MKRKILLHCLSLFLFIFFVLNLQAGVRIGVFPGRSYSQEAKRLGINIGSYNRWGGGEILQNIISNPGFEPGMYNSIVIAEAGSTENSFRQKHFNNVQPEGFWNGAEYEIVWGEAKGRTGTITSYVSDGENSVFGLDGSGTAPGDYDVMIVRKDFAPGQIAGFGAADTEEIRPGSPGVQSMILTNENSTFNYYMDSYYRDGDQSAGKLFPVKGAWHFECWAKGENAGDELSVSFFRENEGQFLNETITLTSEWQRYEFDFDVPDDADPVKEYGDGEYRPILCFRLQKSQGDNIWVDDMLLTHDDMNPTVFSTEFVNKLKELNPGIIRDWSNQNGNDLDNQLATLWARKTNGYSLTSSEPGAFSYSLHEFLELAKELGAEPWYVIPPSFSESDLENLIEYLAAPSDGPSEYAHIRAALGQLEPWTSVFKKIHLEFGNEMWGGGNSSDPFNGTSVSGGVRLGNIASDRFQIMQSNSYFDSDKFNLIIGGQAGYSGRQEEIENNSDYHNSIALAPYFGILDNWDSDANMYYPLFASPSAWAKSTGRVGESKAHIDAGGKETEMSIYEINFHTTSGDCPIDIRNDYLTGAAGAIALPLSMLTYMRDLDVVNQCAFGSTQYSYHMGGGEYARLWGLLRDIYASGRKRPGFLGLEIVNKGIFGSIATLQETNVGNNEFVTIGGMNGVETSESLGLVQVFKFERETSSHVYDNSYILFNLSLEKAIDVYFDFYYICSSICFNPSDSIDIWQLAPESIHSNNEDSVELEIEKLNTDNFDMEADISLPPLSITVINVYDMYFDDVEDQLNYDNINVWFENPAKTSSSVYIDAAYQGNYYLELSDSRGRLISKMNKYFGSGKNVVAVNELNGNNLSSGVYYLKVQSGRYLTVKKMIIVE